MSPSSIPDAIPPIPIPRDVPGLVWTREQLGSLGAVGLPRPLDAAATGLLPVNTPVELEAGTFVVLGERIGEGKQGIVYSVATCDEACVKVSRNDRAAKQFRRELLGVGYFDALGVAYPMILAADGFGRWIVKERWLGVERGDALLAVNQRRLPLGAIRSLHEYVKRFETAGLCADWMPSNLVFERGVCATFETAVWEVQTSGWSFMTCFLPVWLPHGIAETDLEGFPPYKWPARAIGEARRAWDIDPAYETWRNLFGSFPTLCRDWWRTEGQC